MKTNKKIIIGNHKKNWFFKVPFNVALGPKDFDGITPPVVPALINQQKGVVKFGTNSECVVFLNEENIKNRSNIELYCTKEYIRHVIGKNSANLKNLIERINFDYPNIESISVVTFEKEEDFRVLDKNEIPESIIEEIKISADINTKRAKEISKKYTESKEKKVAPILEAKSI